MAYRVAGGFQNGNRFACNGGRQLDDLTAQMTDRALVGLRLGELSGVNADALTFSFEVLVKGTDMEPLELEIEHVRRRQRCPACGGEFDVIESDTRCPTCGEPRTRLIAGDEMNIIYLEVEE